jgi:hypothetical protein
MISSKHLLVEDRRHLPHSVNPYAPMIPQAPEMREKLIIKSEHFSISFTLLLAQS